MAEHEKKNGTNVANAIWYEASPGLGGVSLRDVESPSDNVDGFGLKYHLRKDIASAARQTGPSQQHNDRTEMEKLYVRSDFLEEGTERGSAAEFFRSIGVGEINVSVTGLAGHNNPSGQVRFYVHDTRFNLQGGPSFFSAAIQNDEWQQLSEQLFGDSASISGAQLEYDGRRFSFFPIVGTRELDGISLGFAPSMKSLFDQIDSMSSSADSADWQLGQRAAGVTRGTPEVQGARYTVRDQPGVVVASYNVYDAQRGSLSVVLGGSPTAGLAMAMRTSYLVPDGVSVSGAKDPTELGVPDQRYFFVNGGLLLEQTERGSVVAGSAQILRETGGSGLNLGVKFNYDLDSGGKPALGELREAGTRFDFYLQFHW
jgi:hypothetical protein